MTTSKKTAAKTSAAAKPKAMPTPTPANSPSLAQAKKQAEAASNIGPGTGPTGLPTTSDGTTAINEDSAHPKDVQAGQPSLDENVTGVQAGATPALSPAQTRAALKK